MDEHADTFRRDLLKDLKADYVIAIRRSTIRTGTETTRTFAGYTARRFSEAILSKANDRWGRNSETFSPLIAPRGFIDKFQTRF
jgi:hypothetical protein